MGRYAGVTPGVGDLLRIVDIRTKVVSISSLLVGSAWAHAKAPEQFSWTLLALLVAATLAIDMGTTGFNSYFDFRSGVDTRESDRERFKALVQRDIDPRVARDLSAVLFALAVPLGLAIGARAGWGVVAAGVATLQLYRDEDLFARARKMAPVLEKALHSLKGARHVIDIRNGGLVGAVELEPRAGAPGTRTYDTYVGCWEKGLLVRQAGEIICFAPALIVEESHIAEMVDTLRAVLARVD